MEHPEFRAFYNEYLSDPDKAEAMLLFMRLYSIIDKYNPSFMPYQKVVCLKKIIDTAELRQAIISSWLKSRQDTTNVKSISAKSLQVHPVSTEKSLSYPV